MVARRGSPPLPGSSSRAPYGDRDGDQTRDPDQLPLSKAKRTDSAFWWLWGGQLVSNLGTQVSLYGLGLWLFQLQNHLLDFAAVAIVVQLAKILALPVVGPYLQQWRRRRVMVVANGLGALGTLALAALLLSADRGGPPPSLLALLPLQGLAAAAEASLVLCFASLIPLLVPAGGARHRANGLFASSDGLVLIAAPFLGAWLVGIAGLRGVLVLDGLSFGLALTCVLLAPWPLAALAPASAASRHAAALSGRSWAEAPIRFGRDLACLWSDGDLRRLTLLGTAMAFVYGATEVLFPAWVITALGNGRLGGALVVGGLAYGLGLRFWLAHAPRLWGRTLANLLVIQSLALMGAGLVVFEELIPLWYAGLGCFTLALPVCLAIVQSRWQQLVPVAELPRLLSVRYALEWLARLAAFIGSALVVDQLLRPALAWPHWPEWLPQALGTGPGRPMAVALGGLGWVLLLALVSQSLRPPGLGWLGRNQA